jgi:hypothetical protein
LSRKKNSLAATLQGPSGRTVKTTLRFFLTPIKTFAGNRDPKQYSMSYFFFDELFFVVFFVVPHFLIQAMSFAPPFT